MTQDEFIKRAKKIYNDEYDYSKVNYINAKTPIIIICHKKDKFGIEHGEFLVEPSAFLHKKCGCKRCNGNYSYNFDEFIKISQIVHGDKYDYSKVNYVNASTKVCIICPEHGEFWQLPHTHFTRGCNLCSKPVHDTKSFIKKAKEVHGDKYDYSKVNYINSKEKVCIICPEHGEFWQIPNNHLRKRCCPHCSMESMKHEQALSTDEFIKRANIVHKNKYDYSKVNYINLKERVCIICPEHGEFWQPAGKHLAGHKCHKCKMTKLEIDVFYMLQSINIDFIYQANKKHISWIENQTLDFYIPSLNIGIECQGDQHFIPVRFGPKTIPETDIINGFNHGKLNDKRKLNNCLNNNCKLIYYCKEIYATDNDFSDIEKLKNFILNMKENNIKTC